MIILVLWEGPYHPEDKAVEVNNLMVVMWIKINVPTVTWMKTNQVNSLI